MHYDAIIADIGATQVSLALVTGNEGEPRFAFSREVRCDRYPDVFALLTEYRDFVPAEFWPRDLSLSVSGPVTDTTFRVTHTDWSFAADELRDAFGFAHVFGMNDMAAFAGSLPNLGGSDILPLGRGASSRRSSKMDARYGVVRFSGDGVGGAIVDERGGQRRVLAGETGHATFAPINATEDALRARLSADGEYVSWEAAFGPRGLPGLYAIACEEAGETAQDLSAIEVLLYGRMGTDAACTAALAAYWRMVGHFLSDTVLQTGSFDGLYVTLPSARAMWELMNRSDLRAAFQERGVHAHLLGQTPIWLVTHANPNLLGATQNWRDRITDITRDRASKMDLPSVLTDVADCTSACVLLIDANGDIDAASPQLFADTPIPRSFLEAGSPSHAVGQALVDAGQLGPDDRGVISDRIRSSGSFEIDRRAFGGRRFRLSGSPRADGGYVIIDRDVTEELSAADEMRGLAVSLRAATVKADAASRAKSEFLANMSHEIRTPMNGVLGMADILSRTPLSAEQDQIVDVVTSSAQALLTVINDILDFSKVEAGKMRLEPAPFDLRALTEDVAAAFGAQIDARGIELMVRYAPGTPELVVGDAGRLRQALTNIVGNAVKFTDDGHVLLEVAGEAREDGTAELTIRVEDTGCGIPQSQQAAIFEVFGQADGTATRSHEGTGLGLNITRSIIDLMGGRTDLASREGEGTTFAITLAMPLSSEREAARVKTPAADVAGRRVLIVDDKAINRRILAEQVQVWGMEPVCVESGADALAMLHDQGGAVDVAILDFQMPGMDGVALAKVLRDDPRTAALPLVLLTSVGHAAETDGYGDARFDAALVKPARGSQLRDALGEALKVIADPTGTQERAEAESPAPAPSAAAPEGEPVAEAPAPEEGASAVPHRKLKVLVAEDNPVNRMVIAAMLSSDAYEVEMVEDGQQAVDAFGADRPDVVLMDISMPRLDGFEATRAIRAMEEGGDERIPVIGVTAHAVGDVRASCLEAGMDSYVPKPLQKRDIEDAIEDALRAAG